MNSKVITIAQQKGGSGKTTLAIHLAVGLYQQGNKVAVIDIDPQGSFTRWYERRAEKFGNDFTGIKLIKTVGWRAGGEISMLKRKHDFIIIDSPPHAEADSKATIKAADLVILPTQPSQMDLWALEATVNLCVKEEIPYLIVPNRVSANSRTAKELFAEINNITSTTIGNRVAFTNFIKDGKTVTEVEPNSQAASEIKSLVNEVTKVFEDA
ncbi:MAG: ParA family protein [Alphaproteobacteria bacterium]|nr:ParA family protein [Alphaproteobacteria bacterium]OJV15133.1 MAG: hypothetical protein BGO27_06825 [Alphaproteobacteria bacterium 33-17]